MFDEKCLRFTINPGSLIQSDRSLHTRAQRNPEKQKLPYSNLLIKKNAPKNKRNENKERMSRSVRGTLHV